MKKHNLKIFKIFASITFVGGMLLHVLGLYFGQEYFLKNVLTPTVDAIFSIPMTLAALFSWLAFKQIDFGTKKWKKIAFVIMAVYLTISIPIHLKSWFSNDMNQIKAFPEEYSYFILPIMLTLLIFSISLKKKHN